MELDWLIIGGESGLNARPCNVEWIRSLAKQGQAAGVATFVKQLGANAVMIQGTFSCDFGPAHDAAVAATPATPIGLTDKKGGDPAEWPADLRVQEWPKQ